MKIILNTAILGLWCVAAIAAESDLVMVQPADNGAELSNPGMGWVLHYYDNVPEHYGSKLAPSDTLDDWPGLTVVYLRIPWSYIEPEEGQFNWSVLDTLGGAVDRPRQADCFPHQRERVVDPLGHAGVGCPRRREGLQLPAE